MKFNFKRVLASALVIGMSIPAVSYATNGYFLIGYGAKSRSMGGVGVAYNMNGMAAAMNPASMIESSDSIDLGAEIFRPEMHIYHNSGLMGYTNENSARDIFLIPSMGGIYKWNDRITLGAAIVGAGMKTRYNQTKNSGTCGSGAGVNAMGGACPPTVFNILNKYAAPEAGVELYQMQMLPSIAYRLDKHNTVGASVVMAVQYFRAVGLEDFGQAGFTANGAASTRLDSHLGLTDVGYEHSVGKGYRIGWLGQFMNGRLTFGVNYNARVHMQKFVRYKALFAEQGGFDIPENYTVGFAYKVKPKITAAFNWEQILYHNVKSIGDPGPNAAVPTDLNPLCPGPDTPDCKLGGTNGMGFGWTDMTIYKLGVDWQYSDKIALRAGYNYGRAPIPGNQILFNLLAPAVVERHLTLGGEYNFNKDYTLMVNYMHAFRHTIKGPTAFGPGGAVVNGSNAAATMYIDSIGGTLEIKF